MTSSPDIFDQALKLPEEQRAELAHQLLESLGGSDGESQTTFDQEWAEEIERRSAAYRSGEMPAEDWRVVMKRLRASLEEKRKQ
ncbi:MAG: addiction module protein [Planctomycetes bacterium]|nr:addiction module protein [Planctomycetota bacterium]